MKNTSPQFSKTLVFVSSIHVFFILVIIFFLRQSPKPQQLSEEKITWLQTASFSSKASSFSSAQLTTSTPPSAEEEKKQPLEHDKEEQIEAKEISPSPSPDQSPLEPVPENLLKEPLEKHTDTATEGLQPLVENKKEQLSGTSTPVENSKSPLEPMTPQESTLKAISTSKPKLTTAPKPKQLPKPTPKSSPKSNAHLVSKKEAPASATSQQKQFPLHKNHSKEQSLSGEKEKKNPRTSSTEEGHSAAKDAFLQSKNGQKNTTSKDVSGGGGIDHGVLTAYHELIHDRFYSQWEQPTTIPTEHKHDFLCTLELTIEPDGTISHVALSKPSGNPIMDASVQAAAAKVSKIAPLPRGITAAGAPYVININFELE